MVERPIVLDASATMAWCFSGERTAQSEALRDRVGRSGAVVPAHWSIEIENTLRAGERRGRTTALDIQGFIRLIRAAPLEIDVRPLSDFGNLAHFARALSLSVYDAAYVELAQRRGLPLATLDGNMRRAAAQLAVEVL
jgi:predicted nucleic acid-binding protein